MIRTLIVDDEPLARRTLRHHLEPLEDFDVVGERGSGAAAVDAVRELRPDLLFLDIRMPDLSGFQVLRRLEPEERPYVVFVTAFDAHALEAFQVNALAYLLKPFDDLRFREVVERCRAFFAGEREGDPGAPGGDPLRRRLAALLGEGPVGSAESTEAGGVGDRLVVRSGNRTVLVPPGSIDWIEAEGNYARVHCRDGAEHLVGRPLGELLEGLDPRRFVRIHRSTAVNLERVRELRTEDHRDFRVLLEGGTELRLSRTYRRDFEERIGERL